MRRILQTILFLCVSALNAHTLSANTQYWEIFPDSETHTGVSTVLQTEKVLPTAERLSASNLLREAGVPENSIRQFVETGKFPIPRGGAYGDIPAIRGQVHHIPAGSINGLTRAEGPAIRMETADHMRTASWGRSKEAQAYRDGLSDLVQKGETQYNKPLLEMLEYVKTRWPR